MIHTIVTTSLIAVAVQPTVEVSILTPLDAHLLNDNKCEDINNENYLQQLQLYLDDDFCLTDNVVLLSCYSYNGTGHKQCMWFLWVSPLWSGMVLLAACRKLALLFMLSFCNYPKVQLFKCWITLGKSEESSLSRRRLGKHFDTVPCDQMFLIFVSIKASLLTVA